MKLAAVLCLILALFGMSLALKHYMCGQPPAFEGYDGFVCFASFQMWTYYRKTNECKEFIYGGCKGNSNRFDTLDECEAWCKE